MISSCSREKKGENHSDMYKKLAVAGFVVFLAIRGTQVQAQTQQLYTSQQFRLGDRIIRIAEQGVLADSVNVWGDVGSSGRYVVPRGTTLPELLSYGFGPNTLRDGQTEIDWSKMRVEINVQEYDSEDGIQTIEKFRYRFEEPFPEGMHDFVVENGQTITVRVKRKAAFRDYISVIAPTITAIATSITTVVLIMDLNNN